MKSCGSRKRARERVMRVQDRRERAKASGIEREIETCGSRKRRENCGSRKKKKEEREG
jgi:hypothetical protein